MLALSGRPLADNPLDAPLFVDRDQELKEVAASAPRRINVLVRGPRGIGKTSFLFRLQADLRAAGHDLRYIDGRVEDSVQGLLRKVQHTLFEPPATSLVEEWARLTLPSRVPSGEGEQLLRLIEDLKGKMATRAMPLILLLDEMPSKDEARKLFARLRDEIWQLPIVWVVAVNDHDADSYVKPPADAFFGRITKLGSLTPAAAEEMLRLRLPDLPKATIAALVQEAGGHPRRLLQLASEMVISGDDVHKLTSQAEAIRQNLGQLGNPARRLYAELEARGGGSASDPDLLARLGWKRARTQQVLAQLERAGLVDTSLEPQERGGPKKVYRPRLVGAA